MRFSSTLAWLTLGTATLLSSKVGAYRPFDQTDADVLEDLRVAADEVGVQQELVVVYEDAGAGELGERLEHPLGSGSQRRNVAEADDPIDARVRDVGEDRAERDVVPMKIGDERGSHCASQCSIRSLRSARKFVISMRSPSGSSTNVA
jgi:hypothetical protein